MPGSGSLRGERGPNFPLLSSCFWFILRGSCFQEQWSQSQARATRTEKRARAESVPLGEQARCTVWKGFPWENGGGCPRGKHSPGETSEAYPDGKSSPRGASKVYRSGSLPLKNKPRCTVWVSGQQGQISPGEIGMRSQSCHPPLFFPSPLRNHHHRHQFLKLPCSGG